MSSRIPVPAGGWPWLRGCLSGAAVCFAAPMSEVGHFKLCIFGKLPIAFAHCAGGAGLGLLLGAPYVSGKLSVGRWQKRENLFPCLSTLPCSSFLRSCAASGARVIVRNVAQLGPARAAVCAPVGGPRAGAVEASPSGVWHGAPGASHLRFHRRIGSLSGGRYGASFMSPE